jgi:hypothetical protein
VRPSAAGRRRRCGKSCCLHHARRIGGGEWIWCLQKKKKRIRENGIRATARNHIRTVDKQFGWSYISFIFFYFYFFPPVLSSGFRTMSRLYKANGLSTDPINWPKDGPLSHVPVHISPSQSFDTPPKPRCVRVTLIDVLSPKLEP